MKRTKLNSQVVLFLLTIFQSLCVALGIDWGSTVGSFAEPLALVPSLMCFLFPNLLAIVYLLLRGTLPAFTRKLIAVSQLLFAVGIVSILSAADFNTSELYIDYLSIGLFALILFCIPTGIGILIWKHG